MKSRLTYIAIVVSLITLGAFAMSSRTNIASSQTAETLSSEKPGSTPPGVTNQSEDPKTLKLEVVLEKLRDKEFRTASPKEFQKVINRAEVIAGANASAETDADPSAKVYSPELLSALIDLLDWEQPRRTDDFDPAYGRPVYPAIHAIAKMQKQALPAIVGVLQDEKTSALKYQNTVEVVRIIMGRDNIVAANYLTVQAASATSKNVQARILKSAEQILELQRKYDNPAEPVLPVTAGEVRKVDIEPKAKP